MWSIYYFSAISLLQAIQETTESDIWAVIAGYVFFDFVVVIIVFADYGENKVAASATGGTSASAIVILSVITLVAFCLLILA